MNRNFINRYWQARNTLFLISRFLFAYSRIRKIVEKKFTAFTSASHQHQHSHLRLGDQRSGRSWPLWLIAGLVRNRGIWLSFRI